MEGPPVVAEAIVLDASAAVALVRNEPAAVPVREFLRTHLGEGGGIHVPDLFWLEVGTVLGRRYGLPAPTVIAALRLLDEVGIATTAVDRPLLLLAIDRAEAHDLSLYDAVYLALAEVLDAGLVTLDEALSEAAGERVRPTPLPRSTAEELAPYRTPTARERLAAIGTYLAELRRVGAG